MPTPTAPQQAELPLQAQPLPELTLEQLQAALGLPPEFKGKFFLCMHPHEPREKSGQYKPGRIPLTRVRNLQSAFRFAKNFTSNGVVYIAECQIIAVVNEQKTFQTKSIY